MSIMNDLFHLYEMDYQIKSSNSEVILGRPLPLLFVDFLPIPVSLIKNLILEKICNEKNTISFKIIVNFFNKIFDLLKLLSTNLYKKSSLLQKMRVYFFNSSEYYIYNGAHFSSELSWKDFLLFFEEFIIECTEAKAYLKNFGKNYICQLKKIKFNNKKKMNSKKLTIKMKLKISKKVKK